MHKKIECDLPTCTRKFVPRAAQQRFCSAKHRDTFHNLERQRLMLLARKMGVGK